VAVWLLLFSLPFFLNVPEMTSPQLPMKKAIKRGLSELIHTLKTLPQQKNLFLYLVAHLIYIDGLNTLFAFGGIYAAGTFKMDLSEVILFGIAMNLTAGIGAFFLAWVDDLLGSKPTILISLTFLTIFGIAVLLIESKFHFWIFGLSLSFFVGSVQAASRSLMARLSPEEKSAGMFGLYSFSGRATAFVGPWLLGVVTLHFHTQRAGMATVILFFIVGGILMCFVREPRNISRYTNQTF
jgi:UMF1 family MFS transporter